MSSPDVETRQPPRRGVPFLQEVAQDYNRAYGLPPLVQGLYVPVSEERGRRIARAFAALPHNLGDRNVAEAYTQAAVEIHKQFKFVREGGMIMEPWPHEGQPYPNSEAMIADVSAKHHYFVFTGGDPHPALNDPWPDTGWRAHDELRAVHDLFGHAQHGYGFGPRGEENAWVSHMQMLTDGAQRAITTETRGHTSFFYFGDHNYDENGNPRNIPLPKRPYGEQKAIILPHEALDWRGLIPPSIPPTGVIFKGKNR